ncbi:MAG: hypothetical protein JO197_22210 [Acidobacteria bacterium]|nr:hypothetical protein [Acidobacteriota bacterium]MBV9474852.1 hypothetical protein [Acidobacteriota bacterium]
MKDVHIIFTGITALVPDDTGATVILKNFSDAPEPHQAYVLAESAALQPGSTRVPDEIDNHRRLKKVPATLSAFYLDGKALSIDEMPQTGFSMNTLYILPMTAAVPNPVHARFSQTVFASTNPRIVSGRLKLTGGHLSATWVAPKFKWGFAEEGPFDQFIAQDVCLNFQTDKEFITLRMTDAAGTDVLKIGSVGGLNTIEVRIGNVPSEEIILDDELDGMSDCEVDRHFPLYYTMCHTPPPAPLRYLYGHTDPVGLPHPPQETHSHRLNQVDLIENPPAEMTFALIAQQYDAGVRTAPVIRYGTAGGHNCPPALWLP